MDGMGEPASTMVFYGGKYATNNTRTVSYHNLHALLRC